MSEPIPTYEWKVALRKGGKLTVRAAYVQEGSAGTAVSVPAALAGGSVVLKDDAHKIVFLAPQDCVQSVRRGACVKGAGAKGDVVYVSPGDKNLSPNQIRDAQDRLNLAGAQLGLSKKFVVLPPGSKSREEAHA